MCDFMRACFPGAFAGAARYADQLARVGCGA